MSLLIDALRKAEQQKQQGATANAAPPANSAADRLSLEPLPGQTEASGPPMAASALSKNGPDRRLPELPKRMEELDDQFFAGGPALQKPTGGMSETKAQAPLPSPQPASSSNAASPAREAARNVFAAKQPAPTVGHGFAIAVGIATLIAVVAIGGYFYWQLQPKGDFVANPGLTIKTVPAAQPATPAIQPTPAAPAIASAPAPVAQTLAAAGGISPQPAATPKKPEGAAPRARAAQANNAKPPQAALAQGMEHPERVIRLGRRSAKPDESMEMAHAAFARGELDLARSIWLRMLQSDSRNINALHGLAAIALQENRPNQAVVLYRRVLEVDPKDGVAHAGLLSVAPPADAQQSESRLKGLLAEQPDSPHLNFALGNLYSGDARWAEAQQAFFKAHVADPVNPDYLYNLAVSLDHLHQASLAAQYYAQALDAAKSQRAAFDPAPVEERLKTLRNERQP